MKLGITASAIPVLPKLRSSPGNRNWNVPPWIWTSLGCPQSERLFRPPYSAYDDRLKTYLARTHRRLVLWSIDSGDWQGLAAPAIIKNVLSRVRNGAIIIFHDNNEDARADRHPTVEALRTILPALKAAGYRMVTVSELLSRHGSP